MPISTRICYCTIWAPAWQIIGRMGTPVAASGAQRRCGGRVWSAISSMARNFISTMAGRARWTRLSACTGGEAAAAQQSYEALGAAGQAAVVEFVKSL